jgi:23S rRNA (adenine2030-N6)-methyltransferase
LPFIAGGLFPGSPLLAAIVKRPGDSLWAFEKYEEPVEILKESLSGFEKTYVKAENGFQGLKSLLPPSSKRCLVLIDPPYERPEEYAELALTLSSLADKFLQGTYILWYPHSKRLGMLEPVLEKVKRWGDHVLTIDYYLKHKNPDEGLIGAGLCIMNPPFLLKYDLEQAMPDLRTLGFEVILS